MGVDPLDELLASLEAGEGHPDPERVGRALRVLAHDLNNPIGTFRMELYSLGESLAGADEALGRAHVVAARAELAEVADIRANLDEASRRLAERVATLRRLGQALCPDDE